MSQIIGHISQIIGPVVDVYFDTEGQDAEKVLPKIHDALKVKCADGRNVIIEVQHHIGEDTVRTVAMDNTDGLQRGLEVMPLGGPISMPSGEQMKGRMLNVIGKPIDGMAPLAMDNLILSIVRRLSMRNSLPPRRCSRRASRSLTCWSLT